jgi:hypothetical protein
MLVAKPAAGARRSAGMHLVYRAENLIDAHLVKGLLEQAGIPAFVLGEHLTGGVGELPVMGLVTVGVPDECVDAAERTLADWRGAEATAPLPWDAEPDPA